MNKNIRETLSAGVDGELSGEQLRFLLRRLDHDAALRSTWANYHLAGEALRKQLPGVASAVLPIESWMPSARYRPDRADPIGCAGPPAAPLPPV